MYGQPTFEDGMLEISLSAEDGKKNEKIEVKTEKTEVRTTREAKRNEVKFENYSRNCDFRIRTPATTGPKEVSIRVRHRPGTGTGR